MSATLATAAQALTERLKNLSQRPDDLTVADLISKRLDAYTGRDRSLFERLRTWKGLIGHLEVRTIDGDTMHAAREALATLPALCYKGRDHEGRRILKPRTDVSKSPATVNRYMAAISAVFSWSIRERLTPRGWMNPCFSRAGIKRFTEPRGRVRFLARDELERLLEACRAQAAPPGKTRAPRGARYPRLHALVLTALCTGMRKGELLGLKWGDVDLEAGCAYLGSTKNGDRRAVVLLAQVVDALQPFEGEAQRYVFGSMRTHQRTPAEITTAWRAALARADIDNFHFHDTRHCCASYLAQHGTPLNVIQKILGHRKIDMTLRYAHLDMKAEARAMESALGNVGR